MQSANKNTGYILIFVFVLTTFSAILGVVFTLGMITQSSEFALKEVGKYICPKDTSPEKHTYYDDFGSEPGTVTELYCVGANGEVVVNLKSLGGEIWVAGLMVAGAAVAVVLSLIESVVIWLFRNKLPAPVIVIRKR